MTRRANASGETARLHSSDVRYEAAPVEEDAVLSKFARAAWYCEDAFGYKFDRTLDKKTKRQRDLYVKRENLRYPEHLVCVALLALVSFVEIPLWCLGNRAGLWTWQGHHEVCAAPGHIYLSGIDYWPVGVTLLELSGINKAPYMGENKEAILEKMRKEKAFRLKQEDLPVGWSKQALHFINKCLQ